MAIACSSLSTLLCFRLLLWTRGTFDISKQPDGTGYLEGAAGTTSLSLVCRLYLLNPTGEFQVLSFLGIMVD